jgi:hypothetical protein
MAEGETFKATVITEGNAGTAFVFDFGFVDVTSGSAHIDCGIAAGNFQTMVQATMAAALPSEQIFRKYRFACVGGAHVGEIGYVVVDPPVLGGQEGDVLPAECAISMKRNTGFSSRRDRGRIFFGAVVTSYRTGDNTDEITHTASTLVAVRDLLKATLTTQSRSLKPVILSAAGTYSGRQVINVEVAKVLVHRKSRRWKSLS